MRVRNKDLYIKKSELPHAGKGLFTRIHIKKGARVVAYRGKLVRWTAVKHLDGINGYILRVNRSMAIDAEKSRTLGRYANDARGLIQLQGVRNNCEYVTDGNRCYLEAIYDINKGEEILVGYGKEYWKLMAKIRKKNPTSSLK